MTLAAPLPLRSTAEWGSFAAPEVIPLRYGETGGRLLQYGQDRIRWVWAGHAVKGIDTIFADGVEVGNWTWRMSADPQGQPIALVEFFGPIDEGAELVAIGRGKLSPLTGAMMDSPADVVVDLMTIAGLVVSSDALADFRRQCRAAGLTVAGSIETETTGLAAIRSLCESIGAIFAPDAAGICSLRDSAPIGHPRATGDGRTILSGESTLASIVNDLTVRHGWQAGEPTVATRVVSDESIRRYGRMAASLDAFWLPGSARVATSVAERLLALWSRPRWSVQSVGMTRALRVGELVAVEADDLPEVTAQVLGVERDFVSGRTAVDLELVAGGPQAARIAGLAEQVTRTAYPGITIDTAADVRELTIKRPDGRPAPGAEVIINGSTSIIADGAGKVRVAARLMPPGQHLIEVRYDGGEPFAFTVTV